MKEYPDRLIGASTGGPVSGDDAVDRKVWQANSRKLEQAGAMVVEFSLSCPQGGDGTEGAIVSQSAALTAKVVDWVMETSDPNVPKLFKLTGAVTSIEVIVKAVKEVLAKYPDKKAGVTLANSFPSLVFRPGRKAAWDEGIVVGMSGAGVAPISNLTLASVGQLGVTVSGNGGPMDYRSAAHFLALGARTVQFCTVAMKYGVGIVGELHSGLSHLMQARGIRSVEELIGRALPDPVTDFMALSATQAHPGADAGAVRLVRQLHALRLPGGEPGRRPACRASTRRSASAAACAPRTASPARWRCATGRRRSWRRTRSAPARCGAPSSRSACSPAGPRRRARACRRGCARARCRGWERASSGARARHTGPRTRAPEGDLRGPRRFSTIPRAAASKQVKIRG